jgi:hypothetical protein
MSNQNLDYAAIRSSVEKRVTRQKWIYRILFFVMHLLFFVGTMLVVWGTVAADAQLRAVLFAEGSGAPVLLLVPTIMWAMVLLFHVASLYIESAAGEKAMRERLLMREVGEEILRKGLVEEGMLEKPKRRTAAPNAHYVLSADDGELVPVDEDERIERSHHAGN